MFQFGTIALGMHFSILFQYLLIAVVPDQVLCKTVLVLQVSLSPWDHKWCPRERVAILTSGWLRCLIRKQNDFALWNSRLAGGAAWTYLRQCNWTTFTKVLFWSVKTDQLRSLWLHTIQPGSDSHRLLWSWRNGAGALHVLTVYQFNSMPSHISVLLLRWAVHIGQY